MCPAVDIVWTVAGEISFFCPTREGVVYWLVTHHTPVYIVQSSHCIGTYFRKFAILLRRLQRLRVRVCTKSPPYLSWDPMFNTWMTRAIFVTFSATLHSPTLAFRAKHLRWKNILHVVCWTYRFNLQFTPFPIRYGRSRWTNNFNSKTDLVISDYSTVTEHRA